MRSTYSRSLIIRLTNAALSFGISILLARLMGPESYGAYGVLLSTATLLAIPLTSGLPRAISRDLAAGRVNEDPGRMHAIITMGRRMFLGILVPLLLGAIVAWHFGVTVAGLSSGILISAVLAPLLAADSNRMAIMQGLGQALRSQIPDLIARPLGTATIVIVLLLTLGHTGPITGAFAYASATLFGFLVGVFMVRSTLKAIPHQEPLQRPTWQAFLPTVLTLSILGGSKILTGNIDILLVERLGSLTEAGYYKVALAGMAIVAIGTNSTTHVAYTRFAEAVPKQDTHTITRESDKALLWSFLSSSAVLLTILVLGRFAIGIAYGASYLPAWNVVMVLAGGFALTQLLGPSENIAMLSGKQLLAAGATIIGVLCTIASAIFLAPAWGSLGIAAASALGTFIRQLLIAGIVYRQFGIDITLIGYVRRKLSPNTANATP